MRALVISIRLYEGRYHGAGEWPPAPARLFQALVAGGGLSGPLESLDREALEWLERLDAPTVGAPRNCDGQAVTLYVPNNDLDKVGGDPRRIAEIRGCQKLFKPRLFDATIPFVYAWTFDENLETKRETARLVSLAERLYQFGRGIDFACAWGEVLERDLLEEQILAYAGTIHRPSLHGEGYALKCLAPGSLKSLAARYQASGRRFRVEQRGRTTTKVFTKPPIPRFAPIFYNSPIRRYVFELREASEDADFSAWPLAQITQLVELLRDKAVARLCSALPSQRTEIERVLVGRKPDGANDGPPADRVRILPLPSIGHPYSDRGIRRVLVEISPNCPLYAADVGWALSGLELPNSGAGETSGIIVTPAALNDSEGLLGHYGIGSNEAGPVSRTITPAALPESAARRRIDPKHRPEEFKGGQERSEECSRAAAAVVQALRHARVPVPVKMIRVQREPFEFNGERVEAFAEVSRFSKHHLWHVEAEFSDKISGPLVIGDGRFLGLGLMAPIRANSG